jgi:hypothetical protein
MFKCWRDAFEDFIPGVKAEWKQVFHNRVRCKQREKDGQCSSVCLVDTAAAEGVMHC